jgi:hypothetical protein
LEERVAVPPNSDSYARRHEAGAENFNTAISNAPKITSGKVVAHSNAVTVA